MELKEFNGISYVSARELHKELDIKKQFSDWIKNSIKAAMLDDSEFFTFKGKSSGGRRPVDYMLKKMAAISIAVMSRGKNAKFVRDKIVNLYEQHNIGKAFTHEQYLALIDLSRSLVLVSIQKDLERKHFELYGHPQSWWQYRASIIGHDVSQLKQAMAKVNKKFRNQRQALMKLDPHELVRIGIIDLFKTLGKTNEFAQNVGNVCKDISKKINFETDFFDDTKDDPLGVKKKDVDNRKELFNNSPIKKIKE
jgi:phage anti-repressor protein